MTELSHLRYFYTVAKEGSFTRASKALRIQQPTVSKMVKTFEAQLGFTLIERDKKGLRLTETGEEIYKTCQEIFDRVDRISFISDRANKECHGPLAFGATDSVSSYLIPQILGNFLQQYPKVRPSVFSGSSNLICTEILDGKIEFGVFFTYPEQAGLQSLELLRVPFHLVVATSQIKHLEIHESFIISRDIDYPKNRPFPVLEMLKKNKVKFEILISSNNLDSQKELVKQGLGVALLPRFMVKSSIQSGSLSVLKPKKDFNYSLKLVTRKGKVLSKNSTIFLEAFKATVQPLL